jgi:hypothetical protein
MSSRIQKVHIRNTNKVVAVRIFLEIMIDIELKYQITNILPN